MQCGTSSSGPARSAAPSAASWPPAGTRSSWSPAAPTSTPSAPRGLSLATPDGTSTLDIPASPAPAELDLREDDVLLLATKTQDAEPLLAEWAWQPVRNGPGSAAADALPVVCAQNGVASERIALRRFRQVYGMCVWMPATHLEPGVVEASGAPLTGLLHLGRYPSGADATADQIGADLTASGFLAPVIPDVMRWKYGKLLANLSNATEAVCGHDAWLHATELRRRVTAEGRAVLDAAGLAYARERESAELRADRVQILPVNGAERVGGSSWQSLTRGTGSIEADFLNGEIVLLGREHGVPTPLNEVLQRLANRPPGTAGPPGAPRRTRSWPWRRSRPTRGSSEPGRLPDQHDVDAAGQLLVDFDDLAYVAVLSVGGDRAGVLEHQAVLVDPLRADSRVGTSFCAPTTKMTLAAPGVGGELASKARRDDERAVAGDGVHAAQRVVGLAADLLHLLQLGGEVQRGHLARAES